MGGPVLPPGTRPGTVGPLGVGAVALVGAGPLAVAVVSLKVGREVVVVVGFGRAGEAVRELGLGVRAFGDGVTALGVGAPAARAAVRTRLAASRRRREAGEPGRRCARRERWLAPVGGRASLEAGALACAVAGRGTGAVVGEEQGLEGLGHLEDGSGQTGLRGWEAAALRGEGLSFSLDADRGSAREGDGAADGVRALRCTCTP